MPPLHYSCADRGVFCLEIYSHSRINCFENCPKQFHFRYVLQLPQETEGIEAFVGKRVHEVLERLYEFVGQDRIPQLPRVLNRYEQLWEAEYDADRVRIVREGVPVSFYKDLGVRCLEGYYRRHYPFDDGETLGIEEHVEFSLKKSSKTEGNTEESADEADGYHMQGFIDRVALARDGAIEIHDYKTGRYMPPQKQLDKDRQLALYQIGLGERYGKDRPVRLVWHFLQRFAKRTSTRTPEDLQKLENATANRIDQIRAETEYLPNKIPLCSWCEYKPLCPAWNDPALNVPASTEPARKADAVTASPARPASPTSPARPASPTPPTAPVPPQVPDRPPEDAPPAPRAERAEPARAPEQLDLLL
jgi:putative RecB family exonuclease